MLNRSHNPDPSDTPACLWNLTTHPLPLAEKRCGVHRFRAFPKLVRLNAIASVPATSSEITLYHASRRRWLSRPAFASLTDAASGPNPGGATYPLPRAVLQ